MDWLSVIFIALALAMDAFAVAISHGMGLKRKRLKNALRFGLYFGVFQFAMPLLGYLGGITLSAYIKAIDHWVAFGLLVFIGGRMLVEAFRKEPECEELVASDTLSAGTMAVLALATSIDALAVGISFAVVETDIWAAAAVIGVVAFVLSAVGVAAGCRMGCFCGKYAERLGGVVLVLIGVKILIEHLVRGY